MYIYIGDDMLVKAKDIITIINKKCLKSSPYMNEFLKRHEILPDHLENGSIKSIIVTTERIYYSTLATGTLKKRTQKLLSQSF